MRLDQHRQHLQRGQQAVAGGGEIGQDQVAGLLAADVQSMRPHVLGHVTVADLGPMQRQPTRAEETFQSQIGHHGGDDAIAAQLSRLLPGTADQPEDLVAIDDLAARPFFVSYRNDAQDANA